MEEPNDETYKDWKDRLIHQQLEEHEIAAIEKLEAFQQVYRILEAGKSLKVPAFSEHDSWSELKRSINQPETRIKRLTRNRQTIIRVTLGLLVIASLIIWWSIGRTQTYATGPKITEPVILKNGDKVYMHVASSLVLKPDFWHRTPKRGTMRGEIFFNNSHPSGLFLAYANGWVQLGVGTYNVRIRNGQPELTSYSGSLTGNFDGHNVQLNQQGRVKWNGIKWEESALEPSQNQPPWINGTTYFNDVPLSVAVRELELLYEVTIDINVNPNLIFSGGFPNYDLGSAIHTIEKMYGLKAQYYPGNFIILDIAPTLE